MPLIAVLYKLNMKKLATMLAILSLVRHSSETWQEEYAQIKDTVQLIGRQIMMQQQFFEERARSEGDSGIKNVRLFEKGTNPYITESFSSTTVASIHQHPNLLRTVGMAEVTAVLNGVEFRTRHNDFMLSMRSTESSDSIDLQHIRFPDVPPEVKSKPTVAEQIKEMQLWFKAFKDQDSSVRDYTKYFKPVLCFMEGAWTLPKSSKINEPFPSERHYIDAISWSDLHEKIRFTSNTGMKSPEENYAFLPTTIIDLQNQSTVNVAQWNYKILCHPLSKDISTNRLKIVDDFASRLLKSNTIDEEELARSARFQVNPYDSDTWPKKDEPFNTGLLDKLMYEIPGADNYPANLADDAFGMAATKPDGNALNAGYYHRVFKTLKKGAMGLQLIHRGFSDQNLYVALNTRPDIMSLAYEHCSGKGKNEVCQSFQQKATYAIPLEIIYMTPLFSWNPYNINYRGHANDPESQTVTANERDGSASKQKAYDGIHNRLFYQTPRDFFARPLTKRYPGDTSSDSVFVLGDDGEPKEVAPSGPRIISPEIPDVGKVRLRYPISPVYDEGSVPRKELEAVKKAFLELGSYMHMLQVPINVGPAQTAPGSGNTVIKTSESTHVDVSPHHHTMDLTDYDLRKLVEGEEVSKYTSTEAGHQHYIKLVFDPSKKKFKMRSCDQKNWICWDGHVNELTELV